MTAVEAVAILDSRSGITTMSAEIAHNLEAAFPDVQVAGGMTRPGKLKVADDRALEVELADDSCTTFFNVPHASQKTFPALGVSKYCSWRLCITSVRMQ